MEWYKRLALVSALLVSSLSASASVRITPASGGENISADTAANSISPAWTTLGPITIFERNKGHRTRFRVGTNVTLVLRAPEGFEFNKNVLPSISFTAGKDIKSASVSINSSNLTVKLTVTGQSEVDRLEIGKTKGLQVRPTSGFPLASGNIYRPDGPDGGNAVIAGIRSTSSPDGNGVNVSNFGSLSMSPATAASLGLHTPPSARAVVDLPFGRQPVIAVTDQYGNPVTGTNGFSVQVQVHSGNGVLIGTTNIPVVNGLAAFTNLAVSNPSTVRLKFISGSLAHVLSGPIVVDSVREPAVISSLLLATQPSAESLAGQIFVQQPVVRINDQYDYVITNDYSTMVTAERGSGIGDLQGTLSLPAIAGVVTFTNLSHLVANNIRILFASSGLDPVVSSRISILPAPVSTLAFETQPGDAERGLPFGIQPSLMTQDSFGNFSINGLGNSLLVTIALTSGTGILTGTTTMDIGTDDGDGEIEFLDLEIDSAGIKQLTATAPGLSGAVSEFFTVHGDPQTISFDPLANKTYGDAPFAVSAVASSGLPVSLDIASGPATISGNVVTIIGAGSVTVRATQGGNAHYDPAMPVEQSFVVGKANQAITFAPLADKPANAEPFALTATASSGLSVNFSVVSGPATVSGNMLTITGIGTVTVRASQAGNQNYHAASNVDRSFIVSKIDQTITFAPLPNKTFGDSSFTLTATASSGLPVSLSVISGPASISGNTVTITGVGTVTVRASQGGNSTYNPASNVDRSFDVAKGSQTIAFGALPGRTYGDQPFALSATASSGLPVSFSVVSGLATISNGQVIINGAGTIVIRASQGGNGNYNPAPAVDQIFGVGKASLVVTATSTNRVEGVANPSLSGTITGVKNGDNITANYSTTATPSSSAGTYPITITLNDPDNRLVHYNVTTVNGTLTVQLLAPTVISQPTNVRTNQGANLTLAVDASGNGVIYQWRRNGSNIPGATSASHTISNARLGDSGNYDVIVSNDAGSITSGTYAVTILFVPMDLDENGQADILFQNLDGRLATWYMDGTAFQHGAVLRNGKTVGDGWRVVGQNDMNGDGKTDILFEHADGRMAAWLMDGANFLSSVYLENVKREGSSWRIVGTADFDGNGTTDLLLQNHERKLGIRFMNGITATSGVLVRDGIALPDGWRVVGVRDFNGDGSGDIVFQHVDGRNVVWLMNGATYLSAVSLRTGAANSGWKLVGLSDFNRDGNTDLLWRNTDGRVAVWRMDGTNFVQSILLRNGTAGNPAWFVIGPK